MPTPPSNEDRAAVPLAALLDEPTFGARLLSPAAAVLDADPEAHERLRERRVSTAIVIELPDPTPYLRRDDLLLVTGIGIPAAADAIDAYVSGLTEVGVPALVFGIEPVHSEVPEALVSACRAHGLPLIALPPHVYFAPVILHLSRALEAERTRALETTNLRARLLTEAALRHQPAQRILEVLTATAPGSWALLQLGAETFGAGEIPDDLDRDAFIAGLRHRLGAKSRGAIPTAFTTVASAGGVFEVTAHAATPPRAVERPAVLALARTPKLDRADRTSLLLAANILGLIIQLPAEQSMAVDQLLMHLLVETGPTASAGGERDRFARLLARSLGGARSAHALLAVRDPAAREHPGSRGDEPVPSDAGWLRRLLHTSFVEHRAHALRAYVGAAPSAEQFAEARRQGWLFAVSTAHPLAELRDAMVEAEELARAARRLGRHANAADAERGAGIWPAAAVADPMLAATAARFWLAPLDTPEHAQTREALAVWLRQHGSWDRAARALGLHRNTVRRLIAEAQGLLRTDLEDPIERARILLAFAAQDPDGPGAAAPLAGTGDSRRIPSADTRSDDAPHGPDGRAVDPLQTERQQ